MFLDLSPLRKHPDYRSVFAGQLVSAFGVAVAADMISGLFRMTIWNPTIPTQIRGRMAAIEQWSYMTGPLPGNARVGFMAQRFGLANAIT